MEKLLERGASVLGIDMICAKSTGKPEGQYDFVQADFLKEPEKIRLGNRHHKKRVFFHLAGMGNVDACEKNQEQAFRVNVELTRATLDFCVQNGVSQFVFPSTGLVYGDQHNQPIGEETELAPSNHYAHTKMEAERIIRNYVQESDLCCIILRLANVYGPGMSSQSVIGELLAQIKRSERISLRNYTPVRDFIFIDDVIDGLLAATCVHEKGVHCFNLSSGTETSIRDMVLLVARLVSVPHDATSSERDSKRSYLVMNNRMFRKATGWEPQYTLQDGLKKLLH